MAKENGLRRIEEGLTNIQKVCQPDIFLLQEVQAPAGGAPSVAEQLAERLGFSVLYVPANVWKDKSKEGLAIVSRYPLEDAATIPLPSYDLMVKSRCRVALGTTALTPLGRVRLFNVHLDSRIAADERLRQLSPVISEAERVPGPCVVGGDFNTSYLQWVGRLLPLPWKDQEIRVRRYFEKNGFRTPFVEGEATFDFMGLKLDSIYVRGLGWRARGTRNIKFSDHRGLWMILDADEATR